MWVSKDRKYCMQNKISYLAYDSKKEYDDTGTYFIDI